MPNKRIALSRLVISGYYSGLLLSVSKLLEQARRTSARAVNAVITATYWEVGRRIVEHEQRGESKAEYGIALLKKLSVDLTARFGRGFSERNLEQMRLFYTLWPISQTLSAKSIDREIPKTLSAQFTLHQLSVAFPLPWSHYVRLLSVKSPEARAFYESEALRGGWSVRQLDRQIATQFYERTAFSNNKVAMLTKGSKPKPGDKLTPEQEIKDP